MRLGVASTFDLFVESGASAGACRLARRIVRTIGTAPMMAVLQGGPGSGQTHRLHATGHAVRQHSPTADVVCTTARDLSPPIFTRGFGPKTNGGKRDMPPRRC